MHLERLPSTDARAPYGVPDMLCMAPKSRRSTSKLPASKPDEPDTVLDEPAQADEPAELASLMAELDAAPARSPQLEAALVLQLLEAIHEPVFVLSARADLEQANSLARTWLRRQEGCDAVLALRAALQNGQEPEGFTLSRVQGASSEPCYLARATLGARVLLGVVVTRATHRWRLGERSVRVLEQVASGRSNKEIASALGRSEVTVERHLTQLFRRAGCQSRAELIAKLYAL